MRPGRSQLASPSALRSLQTARLAALAGYETPAALDCREIYEYILAVLAADETITFGVVKPLHCSLFHVVTLFPFRKIYVGRDSEVREGRC